MKTAFKRENADDLSKAPGLNDAEIIEGILTDQKTRTLKEGRGQGLLQNIWLFVEHIDRKADVAIMSNKGECLHVKSRNKPSRQITINHTTSINGTLITWRIPVDQKKVQYERIRDI